MMFIVNRIEPKIGQDGRSRPKNADPCESKALNLQPNIYAPKPGRSGADNRLFVEAVFWIVRVGAPWRDLPEAFGNWNSIFQRFRRWARAGVFDRIFEALSDDADFEYVIVDGPIVRVHQRGTGATGGTQNQAIGRSRGGLTTKIVAL